MTTEVFTRPWGRGELGALCVCGSIHISADLALMNQPWVLSDQLVVLALALPISQCSLCAMWAATSRISPYVRFAVAFVGAVVCWYAIAQILPWGIGDPASAGWAAALALQTFAIVTAIELYHRAMNLAARRGTDGGRVKLGNLLAFDLRTLMLWTTVIGCGFGFIQFGRVEWRWTLAIADWELMKAMPVLGVFNACLGLMWLWALALGSWQWRTAKTFIVVLLGGSTSYVLPSILAWICGKTVIDVYDGLLLTTAQSLYLVASLAVVLIATRNRAL
jgi:hypothetical protein